MVRSVPIILDEIARGIEELRAAIELRGKTAPVAGGLAALIDGSDDLKKILPSVERHVIDRAMRSVKGNQSRGARLLNISRGGLIAKMKQYGIENFRYLKKTGRKAEGRKVKVRARRPTPKRAAASPKRASRQVKASRVLHGRYLGALRRLSPRDREKVKKVLEQKGYAAALATAAGIK